MEDQNNAWYFEKDDLRFSPSFAEGIGAEDERRYRYDGCCFIKNIGMKMCLHYKTVATGTVYFHRFYTFQSFKVFPRWPTAACCLFLAGKAEETPKKCKDIIRLAQTELTPAQFASFSDNPREYLLTLERIVLQTLRFDLTVEHPYEYMVDYSKCFKIPKETVNKILQTAWTFANDSLGTTLCLQWEPEIIAIAMIFLAFKINKLVHYTDDWEGKKADQKHWWDLFTRDLRVELLEDICHQVLDLYTTKPEAPRPDSPPATFSSSEATPASSARASGAITELGRAKSTNDLRSLPPPPPPPPMPAPPGLGSLNFPSIFNPYN